MKTSKVNWHKMLYGAYKDMYLQNRRIFDDFFSTLDNYCKNGDVDLDTSLHLFFQQIQSTMLILFNTQLASSPGFLNCTSRHINELKPFGHYQLQISRQVKASLGHARTLILVLQSGVNVTSSILSHLSRSECKEAFTKMQHCSVCQGLPNTMVCNATCNNFLQSCFAIGPLFHGYWNDYIRSMDLISIGLDGRYNIEAVLGQLAYDISGAIMEFQSNFAQVFNKVCN